MGRFELTVVVLLACMGIGAPAFAEAVSAEGQPVPASATHVFHLEPVERDFVGVALPRVDLERPDIVFSKEPAYEGNRVFRGVLLTEQAGHKFIGLAWDEKAGRLYLDLNRNLDLTDDPEGVFEGEQEGDIATFQNVHIKILHDSIVIPYTLKLQFRAFRRGAMGAAYVRSGWEGVIELYGKERRVAVCENLDGRLDGSDDLLVVRPGGRRVKIGAGPASRAVGCN